MTLQVTHALSFRNFCAVPQSLPSQPCPYRAPLLTPVTDAQAHQQAREFQDALRVRLHQIQLWQRTYSLSALQMQASGEVSHCAWMTSIIRSMQSADCSLPDTIPMTNPDGTTDHVSYDGASTIPRHPEGVPRPGQNAAMHLTYKKLYEALHDNMRDFPLVWNSYDSPERVCLRTTAADTPIQDQAALI